MSANIEDNKADASRSDVEPLSIPKPSGFSLDKFKSKHPAAVAGVETLATGLTRIIGLLNCAS